MRHDPGPAFRALHRPGNPFILANAWDVGSARMLAALGAEAIATSSAAHAFTLGRPDGGHVTRDEALAHAQELVAATSVPVSGDFENGFGDAPETCAQTVRLAAEVGLAGISIEDTELPDSGAYAFDLAVERIRAAAAAALARSSAAKAKPRCSPSRWMTRVTLKATVSPSPKAAFASSAMTPPAHFTAY